MRIAEHAIGRRASILCFSGKGGEIVEYLFSFSLRIEGEDHLTKVKVTISWLPH
jgi:hypothetical protein